MGKYFCRICKVKGFDVADFTSDAHPPNADVPDAHPPNADVAEGSPANSLQDLAEAGASEAGSDSIRPSGTKRKKAETLDEMVQRVKRFVHVSFVHGS